MKTLTEKFNIVFGTSGNDKAFVLDARKSINTYDTFCLYCAENNISLDKVDDHDFESCVDIIDNFISQANDDTGYKISFFVD